MRKLILFLSLTLSVLTSYSQTLLPGLRTDTIFCFGRAISGDLIVINNKGAIRILWKGERVIDEISFHDLIEDCDEMYNSSEIVIPISQKIDVFYTKDIYDNDIFTTVFTLTPEQAELLMSSYIFHVTTVYDKTWNYQYYGHYGDFKTFFNSILSSKI